MGKLFRTAAAWGIALLSCHTCMAQAAAAPPSSNSLGPANATGPGIAGDRHATATFSGNMVKTGSTGTLYFVFSLDHSGGPGAPVHVQVRLPLASTFDAYGEERSCTTADGLVFTAGLDEQNFMPFQPKQTAQQFSFDLNKYLCRVLAAPFRCGGKTIPLPQDVAGWTMAHEQFMQIRDIDTPTTFHATSADVQTNGAFDAAQCPVIAPSQGMCCVGGKSTEWHCGGTPAGTGWHQVSGECFHRDTGATCTQ